VVKMRGRASATGAVVLTLALTSLVLAVRSGPTDAQATPLDSGPPRSLEVFYGSPVLVRSGEAVQVPVDVVCATEDGQACPAAAILRVAEGGGAFRRFRAPATPDVGFDLSAPVSRVGHSAGTGGSLRFQVGARDESGRVTYLSGTSTPPPPLRLYVASDMSTLRIPRVAFGDTVRGRQVLFLPWGTGPGRAGLRPGNESPTLGPSSFDVSPAGSIVLVDALQSRVAEYREGDLVRSVPLTDDPWADVAVGSNGRVFLASGVAGSDWLARVRTIGASGAVQVLAPRIAGMPSQIRRSGAGVFVRLLPEDGWVPAASDADAASLRLTTGRPMGRGTQLVVSGTPQRVRVGIVDGAGVRRAVELTSSASLGSVQLAEPDGAGGFLVVVHTYRDGAGPADQYQVVHVSGDLHVTTFATPSGAYAGSMALSRFRLGPDGALYQMRSASDGVRIFRYEL
jgi:hypothetical protein